MDRRTFLFNDDNSYSSPLNSLLEILEISKKNVIGETQKKWIRKNERWHIEEKYRHLQKQIYPLMKKIGCCDSISISKLRYYDYVLILGAPYKKFLLRLNYFIKLIGEGLTYDKVFILSGERPLDFDHELVFLNKNYEDINEIKNESQMIDYLLLKKPYRKISFNRLSSPMILENKRPTTADTIISWLEKYLHKPGRCLIISNQPYVGYQDTVARTYIPDTFSIETVGLENPFEKVKIAVYLDNLARWLYQDQIRQNLNYLKSIF